MNSTYLGHSVPVVNTQTGPIELCTIFDFVPKVRKEIARQNYVEIANFQKQAYSKYRYGQEISLPTLSKTFHALHSNPMKLVSELKKTTTKKYAKGSSVSLTKLLFDMTNESMINMGHLTHFFPVGHNKFALVSIEDVILFSDEHFNQQLVCVRPERNFVIHVPNLKVDLW